MVPVLLLQVILIPAAASWMMDNWTTRRRETVLQDVASHVGATIQQLYLSLNREEVAASNFTQASNVPQYIEFIPYVITASDRQFENSTFIDLYLALMGTSIATTSRVTLGPNVSWSTSTFVSNSTSAHIKAEKFANGTYLFSFEGG